MRHSDIENVTKGGGEWRGGRAVISPGRGSGRAGRDFGRRGRELMPWCARGAGRGPGHMAKVVEQAGAQGPRDLMGDPHQYPLMGGYNIGLLIRKAYFIKMPQL